MHPLPDERHANVRSRWLLAVGAGLGIVLAAGGILRQGREAAALPEGVIARVNDRTISAQEYFDFLNLLATDKRNPLTEEDRRHVLDRMIEEKLLVERGLDIGLLDSDPRVRKAVVGAMIQAVVADVSTSAPSEEELRKFFDENRAYFMRPARMRLGRIVFQRRGEGEGPAERAEEAFSALSEGTAFETVRARFGDREIVELPNTLLPLSKVRGLIGPSLLGQALQLGAGDVSRPLETPEGFLILVVHEVQEASLPEFATIREQVEAECRRRAGDRALREYLDRLRQEAKITIDEDLMAQGR